MKTDLSNFKKSYKTVKGPEWKASGKEDRHWLWQIPCTRTKGGHIFTYSDTHLAYMSELGRSHGKLRRDLLELGYTRIEQLGDEEFTVSFPVERLDEVASLVRARKRKKLTEEQKALLRAHRFSTTAPKSPDRSG